MLLDDGMSLISELMLSSTTSLEETTSSTTITTSSTTITTSSTTIIASSTSKSQTITTSLITSSSQTITTSLSHLPSVIVESSNQSLAVIANQSASGMDYTDFGTASMNGSDVKSTVNNADLSATNVTSSNSINSQSSSAIPTTTATTGKPTTPTTLPPLVMKQIWCRENYATWKMPSVASCTDTFQSKCSDDIVNATNAYLVCKNVLNKNPSTEYKYKMVMVGYLEDLGIQLARKFYYWRTSTANIDIFRFKRMIKDNMIFEAGITFKWSDRVWPEYNKATLFPKAKWNGRNDTIRLPYATMTAGVFKYAFNMYNNVFDADVSKEEMRLKDNWKKGHLISTGLYIDYMAEKDLIYSEKYKINSAVLSLTIEPKPVTPIASDVIITLWHKKKGMFKPRCVYWQFTNTEDASTKYIGGYWTDYGMRVISTNDTTTICASNHLSAFAVLMEPVYEKPPEPIDDFTLATIILTVVSILTLIVYLIAMVMLRCTRTQYSRMYMYIAASCVLSQIVFVLALMKKDDWSMCTTMSILMQFCHTTVMSWMMIESVHQLSRIRYFFNENSSNIEAFYNCIGWGFPFAVVVALVGYPFDQFSDISVILRLITYHEVKKHPERLKRDINYQRAWRSVVASIFFLPLIAVLWLVATMGVTKSKTEAGPYLVTLPILNLVVGLMVVIFYFYKNDEVQDALVEQRKIKEKKRFLKYEHLKGMKMKVSYKS
eukprot:gene16711-18405_t